MDPPPADHTDAYLAVAAALGGSLITALFAYFQQRRQRESEEIRLDKQLAHERALEDRAHLRAVIEDAAGRLEVCRDRVLHYEILMREDEISEEHETELLDAQGEAVESLEQIRIMERLLDLRVEFTAPLRTAYSDAIEALQHAYMTVRFGAADDPWDVFAIREHRRTAMQSFAAFTSAAQTVIGVALLQKIARARCDGCLTACCDVTSRRFGRGAGRAAAAPVSGSTRRRRSASTRCG